MIHKQRWLTPNLPVILNQIYEYAYRHYRNELTTQEISKLAYLHNLNRFRGLPAPSYPASKAALYCGAFEHLQFLLPDGLKDIEFSNKQIHAMADTIYDALDMTFNPDQRYVLGYSVRPERQVTNKLVPSLHYHVQLGKIRFLDEDRNQARQFKNVHKKRKPKICRNFFHEGVHITDIENSIPELSWNWHQTLMAFLPEVFQSETIPRIDMATRNKDQNQTDRQRCSAYMRNSGRKIWYKITIHFYSDKDCVVINPKNSKKPYSYTVLQFLREVILPVNDNFGGYRYLARGYCNGNSLFGKLMKYATESDHYTLGNDFLNDLVQ